MKAIFHNILYNVRALATRHRAALCLVVLAAVLGMGVPGAQARSFNDKLLNRPYADLKRWHLGFSVGMQLMDVSLANNGYITDNGQSWFMEQPGWDPGFCVNGLVDLRLNNHFNLRFNPGMYFGTRGIHMVDVNSGAEERQSIKTAYVVLPVDLKFSALRLRNVRPYLTTGIMPAFDVSKKRNDLIRFKNVDMFWTIGFGLDTYLPYFKFIPEVKFCFGLTDVLQRNRPDLEDDPERLKFTNSLKKATSKMIVLTFYFE